MATILKKTIPY